MRPLFRVLGAVTVEVNDVEISPETPMVRAVLAALLLESRQYVALERLTHMLWESPPTSAAANVRKYVTRLRCMLGRGDPSLADRLVTRRGSGYRLRVEPHEVDLAQFTELAARGRMYLSASKPATAAEALREGLALWRGDAGTELPIGSPIRKRLTTLNEQWNHAMADLVDARLTLGDSTALIPDLRAAVAARPVDERAWGQLIQALHRAGDPARALEAYHQARTNLREELGIEPSRRLQMLQRAVLSRDDAVLAGWD